MNPSRTSAHLCSLCYLSGSSLAVEAPTASLAKGLIGRPCWKVFSRTRERLLSLLAINYRVAANRSCWRLVALAYQVLVAKKI